MAGFAMALPGYAAKMATPTISTPIWWGHAGVIETWDCRGLKLAQREEALKRGLN